MTGNDWKQTSDKNDHEHILTKKQDNTSRYAKLVTVYFLLPLIYMIFDIFPGPSATDF